jgi:hypothetical protein
MGMLIIKILLLPIAAIEVYCKLIAALVLWDSRPFDSELIYDIMFKKPNKDANGK